MPFILPQEGNTRSFVLLPTSLLWNHVFHQTAFTNFTDSNFRPTKERFTDAFNLFLGKTYSQRSSFSDPHCRLSYPNAVLCFCANEMNVQKRECPRRMLSFKKEKKNVRVLYSFDVAFIVSLFLFENIQFSFVNSEIEFPTKNCVWS